MNKEKHSHRPGEQEWLEAYFYDRWQIIRRHRDYIRFCDDHTKSFDDDGIQDPFNLDPSLRPEAERIRKRFGLEMIYHYSLDIPKDRILVWPVFKNERAVEHKKREDDPGSYNRRYIELRIDITKTKHQIQKDVWWEVEWARRHTGIQNKRLHQHDEVFKVWDLRRNDNKSPIEIIKELWPNEYERVRGNKDDFERDRRYMELCEKYKREGFNDWDEKAFYEGYENEPRGGMITLYVRVKDNLRRMKELFRDFGTY